MSQAAMRPSDQYPHLFPSDYAALCEPVLRGILERCESDQFETLWHAGKLRQEEALIVACLIAEQDMLAMGRELSEDFCRHVLATVKSQGPEARNG